MFLLIVTRKKRKELLVVSSKECNTLTVCPREPCLSSSVLVDQTCDSRARQPITVRQIKDGSDQFRLVICFTVFVMMQHGKHGKSTACQPAGQFISEQLH